MTPDTTNKLPMPCIFIEQCSVVARLRAELADAHELLEKMRLELAEKELDFNESVNEITARGHELGKLKAKLAEKDKQLKAIEEYANMLVVESDAVTAIKCIKELLSEGKEVGK